MNDLDLGGLTQDEVNDTVSLTPPGGTRLLLSVLPPGGQNEDDDVAMTTPERSKFVDTGASSNQVARK